MTAEQTVDTDPVEHLRDSYEMTMLVNIPPVDSFSREKVGSSVISVKLPHDTVSYAIDKLGLERAEEALAYVSEHAVGLSELDRELPARFGLLCNVASGLVKVLAEKPFMSPGEVFDSFSVDDLVSGEPQGRGSDTLELDELYATVLPVSPETAQELRRGKILKVAREHGWDAAGYL